MSDLREGAPIESAREAAAQLEEAAAAKKCWPCGCLHGALRAIDGAIPVGERPVELTRSMTAARSRLSDVKYDCLGCEVCYPALALNALEVAGDACPQEAVEVRQGWPPLPGSYTVLRYAAPVAVCTLVDAQLATQVAELTNPDVALVGSCQTENLGIERLIQNTVSNPHIRFLILCGADSRQTIGHLPGQSFLSLAASGLDERARIVGAKGKRPVLKNVPREMVEHFRRTVEVIDLIGCSDTARITETVRSLALRSPGSAEPFSIERAVLVLHGALPTRMVSDPAGYFVVYPDRTRRLLSLEHFSNAGVLDVVIEGATPAEVYTVAVDRGLVSRLDHACYVGKELTRAWQAMESDEPYVQDAAPEQAEKPCGCGTSCGETR